MIHCLIKANRCSYYSVVGGEQKTLVELVFSTVCPDKAFDTTNFKLFVDPRGPACTGSTSLLHHIGQEQNRVHCARI